MRDVILRVVRVMVRLAASTLGYAGLVGTLVCCAYGGVLLANQGYVWLRHDHWIALPLRHAFVEPNVEDLTEEWIEERTAGADDLVNRDVITRRHLATQQVTRLVQTLPIPEQATNWLLRPRSWIGLNRLIRVAIDLVPLPLAVFVLAWWFVSVMDAMGGLANSDPTTAFPADRSNSHNGSKG